MSEKQLLWKTILRKTECLLILFIWKFFLLAFRATVCENSHNLLPPVSPEKVAPLFCVNLTLHLTELNMWRLNVDSGVLQNHVILARLFFKSFESSQARPTYRRHIRRFSRFWYRGMLRMFVGWNHQCRFVYPQHNAERRQFQLIQASHHIWTRLILAYPMNISAGSSLFPQLIWDINGNSINILFSSWRWNRITLGILVEWRLNKIKFHVKVNVEGENVLKSSQYSNAGLSIKSLSNDSNALSCLERSSLQNWMLLSVRWWKREKNEQAELFCV